MKFRTKTRVIDAFQLRDPDRHTDAADDLHEWADAVGFEDWESSEAGVVIRSVFGTDIARPGDWIIKDASGVFSRCTPEFFEALYEPLPQTGDPTNAE